MADYPKNLAYWTEHSHHWRASGLTQQAYCAREKLALSSFKYWHSQVLAAHKSPEVPSPKLTLAAVSVTPDHPSVTASISLYSPNGWRIDLPTQISPSALGQLLATLP
jgi:hypothetical protein